MQSLTEPYPCLRSGCALSLISLVAYAYIVYCKGLIVVANLALCVRAGSCSNVCT